MAIYHLSLRNLSRKDGRNAVQMAAYRRGTSMVDVRTGERFCYSRKQEEVIHSALIIPKDSPDWLEAFTKKELDSLDSGSAELWNLVEATEKRKDAQLCYEIDVALPKELSKTSCIKLVEQFVNKHIVSYGMVADLSIHWVDENPHCHIAMTTRAIDESGFGKKVVSWKQKAFLYATRKAWADATNYALAQDGYDITISHKSYADQGVALAATRHEGAAFHMADGGNYAKAWNTAVREDNLKRIAQNPQILVTQISNNKTTFTDLDLADALLAQMPNNKKDKAVLREQYLHKLEKDYAVKVDKTIDNLFTKHAVFTEAELAKTINNETDSMESFLQIMAKVRSSNELINLGPGDDGRLRYTTKEAVHLENAIQQTTLTLNNNYQHTVSKKLNTKFATAYNLNQGQKRALNHLLSSSDIATVIGYAGTGKSYLIKCAAEAWQQAGFKVHGIALAGVVAEQLQSDANIPSRTIASYTQAIKSGFLKLNRNDIVVMDEAGMVDNFSFAEVLSSCQQAGAKLVLVGDDGQLNPIGPGAAFRAIVEQIGSATLDNVIRQQEMWQRQASVEFAQLKTTKALQRYSNHKCINLSTNTNTAQQQLISDWQQAITRDTKVKDNIILALKNDDVKTLNIMARQSLLDNKLLAANNTTIITTHLGKREIALGERIMFTKNDRDAGVKNGQRATVVGFGKNYLEVNLDSNHEKIIKIDLHKYNDINYGYASTVHKAQGVTVKNSFALTSGRWNKNLTYVAMTRHKHQAKIYAGLNEFASQTELINKLSRTEINDITLDYPLAFAARRGITDNGVIAQLLAKLPDSLRKTITKITNFLKLETINEIKLKEIAAKLADKRQKAMLVGTDYLAAKQAAGHAWKEAIKASISLGIDEKAPIASKLAALENHGTMQQYRKYRDIRDLIAYKILENQNELTTAIELNDINIETLKQQAASHKRRQLVKDYQTAVNQGRMLLAKKLAANIVTDIKGHYPAICESRVNNFALHQDAKHISYLKALQQASPSERKALRLVKRYLESNRIVGAAWREVQTNHDANIATQRATILRANQLSRELEALAQQIVKAPDNKAALNHFNIKSTTAEFVGPPSNIDVIANNAWDRLNNLANAEQARQNIKQYAIASNQDKLELASKICQNSKLHHPAVLAITDSPNNLWQDIRANAQEHNFNILKQTLSHKEQGALELAKQYVASSIKVSQSFAELATSSIKLNKLPSEQQQLVSNYLQQRNTLADKIAQQPELTAKACEFFNIDSEKLARQQNQQQANARVAKFKSLQGNIMQRCKLAQEIVTEPAMHFVATKNLGIEFKSLYKYASFATKQEILKNLSTTEQKNYLTINKYKNLVKETAITWTASKSQEIDKQTAIEKAKQISNRRDNLAFIIKSNPDKFAELLTKTNVNLDKLSQHAKQYIESVNRTAATLSDEFNLNVKNKLPQLDNNSKAQNITDVKNQIAEFKELTTPSTKPIVLQSVDEKFAELCRKVAAGKLAKQINSNPEAVKLIQNDKILTNRFNKAMRTANWADKYLSSDFAKSLDNDTKVIAAVTELNANMVIKDSLSKEGMEIRKQRETKYLIIALKAIENKSLLVKLNKANLMKYPQQALSLRHKAFENRVSHSLSNNLDNGRGY